MEWVELTLAPYRKILINVRTITDFYSETNEGQEKTKIRVIGGGFSIVTETYQEVKSLVDKG